MEKIAGYAPVADENSRVLILGTVPSVESLRTGFYYAHPRNAFWPVMAEVLGAPVPETVEEKRALLTGHRVALWDVARSCVRPGSRRRTCVAGRRCWWRRWRPAAPPFCGTPAISGAVMQICPGTWHGWAGGASAGRMRNKTP